MRLCVNNLAYTRKNSRVYVNLLCRNEQGDLVRIDVPYKPYCYIREEDAPRLRRPASVLEIEKGFRTFITKEPLVRLYFRTPVDVRRYRERMSGKGIETFEADIPFVRRFLVDKEIRAGIEHKDGAIYPTEDVPSNLRVLILDIEVKAPKDIDATSLARWAKHPIVVVAYWDSLERKIKILSSDNEKRLLGSFVEEFRRIDPDLIVGYNIERFDIPYLLKRCQEHGIAIKRFSPLGRTFWDERKEEWIIKGRTILDYARAYRDYVGRELKVSWYEALDYLAEKYLNIRKIKIKDFEKVWETSPGLIEKRAFNDVAILVKLEELFRIISLYDTIRKEVGCEFRDVFYKSILGDIAMLRLTSKLGVLPNKPRREIQDPGYTGALIVEPPLGIFENIAVLDFGEFYPRIILSHNISPETLELGGEKGIGGTYRFSTLKEGILPTLIRKYLKMKLDIKKELKTAREEGRKDAIEALETRHEAIKRVLNSFYGISAYNSRLKSIEVAEAITLIGRQELQTTIRHLKTLDSEVLYGDTDSLFIKIPDRLTLEELCLKISKLLPKELEMEHKLTFERIVFLTKKRYMGKTTKGEIVRKGIQAIRSDVEDFLVRVQDTLLLMILDKKPKEEILSYLRSCHRDLVSKSIPPISLARPVQLKKRIEDYKVVSHHVAGVKYSQKHLSLRSYLGMKPLILRIASVPPGFPKTDWIALDSNTKLPEGFLIDYDYYRKRLKSVLRDILPLADLSWNEIEYQKLDSFF